MLSVDLDDPKSFESAFELGLSSMLECNVLNLARSIIERHADALAFAMQPFTVDELVKAAQLHSQAIADKSKAQRTGEAGRLPVTVWPGPRGAVVACAATFPVAM